jgi:hypothetical protein
VSNFAGQGRGCRPWQPTSSHVAWPCSSHIPPELRPRSYHRVLTGSEPIQLGLVATGTVQFNDDLITKRIEMPPTDLPLIDPPEVASGWVMVALPRSRTR